MPRPKQRDDALRARILDAAMAQVEKIDRYTQGVQGIRREAMSLCERVSAAPGLANGLEDLDKRLVNAGKRLAKLRETRRYFERRLQAHREGEQFFGDDTIQ